MLLFCSGAAALGYQVVWSRMFAAGLGHETPTMLAIVCAFMFGMALGAWALDGVINRSAKPGRWYAYLELIIGAWAFVSAWTIPDVNELASKIIGVNPSPLRHWLVAFAFPTLTLLPATAAMGATFPAMERFIATLHAGRAAALVYAANTLGAVAGIFLSVFALAPKVGFTVTTLALGSANFACGIAAFLLTRKTESRPTTSAAHGSRRLLITIFATGFLGIGFEVAGTRVLSQVLENTIYSFAAVLAVYLLGTALGAALYQRFGSRCDGTKLLRALLCATSLACALGVLALSRAETLYNFARQLGNSTAAVLAAEMFVAAAVYLVPTLLMGATFSHVVQSLRAQGIGVGRAAALNTFGGALASVLFGVALLPLVGSKWTLVLAAFAYALLAPGWKRFEVAMLSAAAVGAFLVPSNLHVVTVPPGGRIVSFREGVMAAVAVVEDARGDRVLRVNNRFQMGGTAAADAEYRQAHIPLLLHPNPRRALFLGVGTGITLGGAALHTNLFVDGVELVPEVLDAMPLFEPANRAPQRNARFHIAAADARRFVRATTNSYDVIVAELFHPARDGAGALYTLEHFDAIRQRLASDGLFCQWLPLHQLSDDTLTVIVRTFATVFPDTQIWLLRYNVDAPAIALVGSFSRLTYAQDFLERRAMPTELRDELKRLALGDSLRLLGHFVCDANAILPTQTIEEFNTDDAPLVTFRAPRFVYEKNATPYGRLSNLLRAASGTDFALVARDGDFQKQLSAYAKARDVYIRGLTADLEGERERAVEFYVESARLSPEFTSGYAQCLSIASALANSEPAKARTILEQLIAAQPERPVAKELLRRLDQR